MVPQVESWDLFCVTSKGVYFVPPAGGNTIEFLDAVSGKVSALATMAKPIADGLAVSPDEAYALWAQVDRQTFNLMLVEGFR